MALHVINDPLVMGATRITADRELYTDSTQKRLLEAGDKNAAFLVAAGPGSPIDSTMAETLGLVSEGGKVKQRDAGSNKERKDGLNKEDATPPEDDGNSGEPIVAPGASSLHELTVAKLKELAKAQDVPGYATLNKAELVAALAEGGEAAPGNGVPEGDA